MGRRSTALLLGAFALLPVVVVLPAAPASAGAPLPAGFVDQIKAAGADLAGISALEDLTETVPGLGTSPALLLGLHEALGALSSLGSVTDTDALAAAVDALDVGGYDFGNVQAAVTDGVATLSFDLSANRTVPVPLAISTDEVGIASAPLDVSVALAPTTIAFEFNPAIGSPADAFAITTLPTLSLSATLDATVDEPIQFGFADASASGSVDLNTTVGVELVDPDASGRLTGTELAVLSVDDVVALDLAATAPDDVAIDLDLTATVGGAEFGASYAESAGTAPHPAMIDRRPQPGFPSTRTYFRSASLHTRRNG